MRFWTLLDLFKKLNPIRILIVNDLPRNCKTKEVSYNLHYLENKTGEKVFNGYLISISEIVSSCTLKRNGASLFINRYTLAILQGRDCFLIFDSYSRDSSRRKVVNGTAVLLKFLSLHHMDDYI